MNVLFVLFVLFVCVQVADALACEMHAVRLVVEGRELVQDWQLIRQCGIEGNTTVTATVSRHTPEYTGNANTLESVQG